MGTPTLDLSKFSRKVATSDLARTNLFTVVFSSFDSIGQGRDSVLTPSVSVNDSGLSMSRLADVGGDLLLAQSEMARTVLGAYSPGLVRGVFGKDFLDMMGAGFDAKKDLGLMVKSVNIPGSTIEVTTNKFQRKPHNVVSNRTDENITMTFYLTPELAELILLNDWMNTIFDVKTSRVGFYNAYARSMEIFTYNRQGVAVSQTSVIEAFPVRIASINLDADTNNEVATVEVEFQYSYKITKKVEDADKSIIDLAKDGDLNGVVNTGQSMTSRMSNLKNIFG